MKKNGFITGIVGFIIVIALTVVCFVASLMLSGIIVRGMLGDEAAMATYPLSLPAFPLAVFVLLDIAFFATQAKKNFATQAKKNFATQAKKIVDKAESMGETQKNRVVIISRIIAIVCLVAVIPCFVANIGRRTEYREDSIREVFFGTQKEYKPENVLKYTLSVDEYGAQFTIYMKDGKSFELLNNINTCSNAFVEKYDSIEGYASHLSTLYDNSGFDISKTVKWDKSVTYSPDDPNYEAKWKYLIMIAGGDY